jgi:uncharacterized protein YwqG
MMTPEARQAFEKLPGRIKRLVRPSIRLKTTRTSIDDLKLGQSRIGGVPDLPRDFQWPHYAELGLSFIAQLDLAELAAQPAILTLPKHGSLAFFYDSDQRTWGFDPKDRGSAIVAYFPGPASSLVRTPLPADVSETGRFDCCSVQYAFDENLPDPWSPYYDPKLSDDERTRLYNFRGEVEDRPCHRIGGHADCVQNPMELECQLVTNGLYCGNSNGYRDARAQSLAAGALDWRLLLQIGTEDNSGMTWGDSGAIYYWIREEDLRAEDFDKSWLILQCG